jgi:hypothetical protein
MEYTLGCSDILQVFPNSAPPLAGCAVSRVGVHQLVGAIADESPPANSTMHQQSCAVEALREQAPPELARAPGTTYSYGCADRRYLSDGYDMAYVN